MLPYMVGKLAPNSSHLTRGLVKYVPGMGYFRPVSYQNGDKFVTSPPPPQSLNWSSGCSMAKGIRALTPHYTTSRAAAPMDMVHIDTAEPFQESLGGSQHVIMFVDRASRFQRPYGARDKSASAILGVMKRFVVDMGVPRSFKTDNGAEYTNSTFVDYCNGLEIHRELTAPYTPQQKGRVDSRG